MTKATPLTNAERYLWSMRKLSEGTSLSDWYNNGWSMMHRLDTMLFGCSSSHGNKWPQAIKGVLSDRPLFHIPCIICGKPSEGLVNEVKVGTGEDWKRLDDAPRFFCGPHEHEFRTGEPYTPPTEDELIESEASWKTAERMHAPGQSHTLMDAGWLQRYSEIYQQEVVRIREKRLRAVQ